MHDAQLKRYKVAKNYKYICLNINVHIKLPVKYNFINRTNWVKVCQVRKVCYLLFLCAVERKSIFILQDYHAP